MFSKERHDLKCIVIDPRLLAESVVAAGDYGFAVFYLVLAQCVDRVSREIDREAEVVERVYVTLRARREFCEAFDV